MVIPERHNCRHPKAIAAGIKQKHTELLPCVQCIPWLTTSIADRTGGLAALYSEEIGSNITSYLGHVPLEHLVAHADIIAN